MLKKLVWPGLVLTLLVGCRDDPEPSPSPTLPGEATLPTNLQGGGTASQDPNADTPTQIPQTATQTSTAEQASATPGSTASASSSEVSETASPGQTPSAAATNSATPAATATQKEETPTGTALRTPTAEEATPTPGSVTNIPTATTAQETPTAGSGTTATQVSGTSTPTSATPVDSTPTETAPQTSESQVSTSPTPTEIPVTDTVSTDTPTPTATPETPTLLPPETPEPTPGDEDPIVNIDIYPGDITVDIGTSLEFRAVGYREEIGHDAEFEVSGWASSDEEIASIDETGLFVAHSVGEVFISAFRNGVYSEESLVTVQEVGTMDVRVFDTNTGEYLNGVDLYLHDDLVGTTDESGNATVPVTFEGPQTITAWADGYYIASILGTQSRDIEIPVRPIKNYTAFSGTTDFKDMDTLKRSELRLGIITRSVQENPLALDIASLIGDYRNLNLCGIEVALPENMIGKALACDIEILDYRVPGPPGQYSAYAFVGDLPLEETLALISNPDFYTNLGQFLIDIGDELPNFAYDILPEVTLEEGVETENIPVIPHDTVSASVVVRVPPPPDGVTAEYPPLLFVAADLGESGYLPIGLGGGNNDVQVYHAPLTGSLEGKPLSALAIAATEGAGNYGPYSASLANRTDEDASIVELPPFMPVLFNRTIDTNGRSIEFANIDEAMMYRSILTFRQTENRFEWDLYQEFSAPENPDSASGETVDPDASWYVMRIPDLEGAPALQDFNWEAIAYDSPVGTFEGFTTNHLGQNLLTANEEIIRTAGNIQIRLGR